MPERTPSIPCESKDSGTHLRNRPVPIQNTTGRTIRSSKEFGSEIRIIWLDLECPCQGQSGLSTAGSALLAVKGNPIRLQGDRSRTGGDSYVGTGLPEEQGISSGKGCPPSADRNVRIGIHLVAIDRNGPGN